MRRVHHIPQCERCDQIIVYNPMLGDLNAGPVHLLLAAYTLHLEDLCAECVASLFQWIGARRPPDRYTGVLRGKDKMSYLPRADGQPLLASEVRPPTFRS